jgi:hypothetical protein
MRPKHAEEGRLSQRNKPWVSTSRITTRIGRIVDWVFAVRTTSEARSQVAGPRPGTVKRRDILTG